LQSALKVGTKKVGEDCECDTYGTDLADYTTRIVPKTFCGAEDAFNKIEAVNEYFLLLF
jgi:hypothetical protein